MADLPRDIGFDDDPVVLLNYVMLDDMQQSVLQSPSHIKPHLDSSYTGCFSRQSKSSSTSELSTMEAYEMTESTENLLMPSKKISFADIRHDRSQSVSSSGRNPTEGEDSFSEYSVERLDSPQRLDYKKLQEQNKELLRRNQKLSNTLDALRKERELLMTERDRLKLEKREGNIRFTAKLSSFAEDEDQEGLKENISPPQTEDHKIQKAEVHAEVKEEEQVGTPQHKSTLNKLIEEQRVSTELRRNNTELTLRIASLETEIEKLHVQNSHNLLLVEQANATAQAATSLIATTNTKQKKKSSLFNIRRSGRKKSTMDSPSKSATSSSTNILSNSQPSLDGSLSEHDLNSILTKKQDQPAVYNPFNKPPDSQFLQTSVKLAMEEKVEVERQLSCLREELDAHQKRIEELLQESMNKERIYVDAVEELDRTKQALQLATREKELQVSENESLSFEIESLRAKKETGIEVKKAALKEKQELEFLRSENKALMSEIRTLIVNSDGLETSLSQLKREKVAKDVREHEAKVKLKKAEQENTKLRRELAEAKEIIQTKNKKIEEMRIMAVSQSKPPPHGGSGSPKITISRNSESPPKEKHITPSTSGQQERQLSDKKHVGPMIPFDPSRAGNNTKTRSLHERAQSEDLTSSHPPISKSSAGGVAMQRTSSGGTTIIIPVQTTLPTKETPLLSTSVPNKTALGSFQMNSPNKSDVNSLVKMFELGKPKEGDTQEKPTTGDKEDQSPSETETVLHLKPCEANGDNGVTNDSPSSGSTEHSSTNRSLIKEKNVSVSSASEKKDKNSPEKEEEKSSERKKSTNSLRSASPSQRKSSNTSSPAAVQPTGVKQSSDFTKKTTNQPKENPKSSPPKERNNSSSSVRKLSHGSSEGKYLQKKDDLRAKEQSHRRTTSLVITNKEMSSTQQKKPKEENPKSSTSDKEKLNTISEKSVDKGTKLTVSKHVSRISVTVEENNNNDVPSIESPKATTERSQTWPTKGTSASSELSKTRSNNNTLPSTSKDTSTSPTQTVLNISKPKPPPTVKTPPVPCLNSNSPTQDSVQSPAGNVRSLKSSWEKKSIPSPIKPLTKSNSANTPTMATPEQIATHNNHKSPNKPITKYGSGPPGVILSTPGIKKPSPPPTTSTPLSPTSKLSRTFHTPPSKFSGSPTTIAASTPTFSTSRTPVLQQNGLSGNSSSSTTSYTNKGSVSKRISSFEPSTLDFSETEVKKRSPPSNGTSSPRFNRRPASLYVNSSQSSDNRQLSSLISILQEKSSNSPPPPLTETKQTIQQPKKSTFQKRETSPVIFQSESNAPINRVTRTKSLSSPVDRRSKKAKLLRWCQIKTKDYDNISINNFGESFSNGLAFCALIHHFLPDKIPYSTLTPQNQRRNFTIAFEVAEELDIPPLLDINDMVEMEVPDWMSVMTYVSYIYKHFADAS